MVCTCVLVFIFESLLMWLYVCGSKGLYVYLSVGHSVFPCLSMCVCVCVSVSSYENVYVRFVYVWMCLLGFSMCLCQIEQSMLVIGSVCIRPCVRLGCHRTQTIIHPCKNCMFNEEEQAFLNSTLFIPLQCNFLSQIL